jgi:uncharacterized protein (DUF362 family)
MTDKSTVAIFRAEFKAKEISNKKAEALNPLSQGEITKMVKGALDLLGGIEQFVKSGNSVVIKPNLFAPFPPPVSVDRRVIGTVVSLCKEAGAKKVTVIEGVSVGSLMKRINLDKSTDHKKLQRGMSTIDVMRLLGVKDAVQDAGGEVLGVEDVEKVRLKVQNGKVLHYIDYPKVIKDVDVLIDIPALKTHTMTMVTLGIKNLQGILNEGDRYFGHRDDLDQHMVDILKIRKPDLTIVDGLIGMEGMGAGEAGLPVPMGLIIAGEDVVSVDSVSSMVMGIENPTVVGTTRIAAHDGIGIANPSMISVVGEKIEDVQKKFVLPINYTQPIDSLVTGVYPNVDVYIGGACHACWLMAAVVLGNLSKIKEGVSLIVGTDPKVPPDKKWDYQNTFFLGDCALGAAGETREIRNRVTLEGHDTFLYGCLPYQQAMVKLENILLERGVISKDDLIKKAQSARERFFSYYKKCDPTWEPVL